MLKLNASYSKKVPAEGEYTSQSYHCSMEVELSDALTSEQIQSRIHETFALVRASVEAELNGKSTKAAPVQPPVQNGAGQKASNKQIKFILDLAGHQGFELSEVNARVKQLYGVASVYDLDKKQASTLLDTLQRKKAA